MSNNDDHDSPQRTLSEPIVTNRDLERRDKLNRSASVTHGRKKRSNESNDDDDDSELFSFLSAMGFSMEQIESAVGCIRREKGRKDIDADDVVAVLLSSQSTEGGEEEQQKPPRKESKDAKSTTALLPLQPAKPDSPYETIDDQQSSNDKEFMKIEVTPGNFAPVLKGCLTAQAIRDGTAISVRCSICNVLLECCPDAEYVLCPDCDVVSPIWRNRDEVQEQQSHHQQRHHGRRGSVTSDGSSSHRSARSHRRMTTGGMIGAIGLGHKVKHNHGQKR